MTAGIRDRLEEARVGDQVRRSGRRSRAGLRCTGRRFVLPTEGNWPQDLVGPIQAWIAGRKKIGRCVRSKCAKCGREIYGCQSESAPLCYDCRAGAKPAKRAWRRMREPLWGLLLVLVATLLSTGKKSRSES